MMRVSAKGSLLPGLAIPGFLTQQAIDRIDDACVTRPTAAVSGAIWKSVDIICEIAAGTHFGSLGGKDLDARKESLLNSLELLFHRTVAANDYLGDLLQACLGKKSKEALSVKKALDYRIERICKMPINMVKHNGFELCWIDMSNGHELTYGYAVTGPVGNKLHAPLKFKPKDKNSPEGYSMALVLRDTFLSNYSMASKVEEVLKKFGFIANSVPNNALDADRFARFTDAIDGLNSLPRTGFPDESGTRVPIYSIQGAELYAAMKPLRMLPGPIRIQSVIRSVSAGMSFKLPYFQAD